MPKIDTPRKTHIFKIIWSFANPFLNTPDIKQNKDNILMLFLINLIEFCKVGTGAARDRESCERLQKHLFGTFNLLKVTVLWLGMKGASSKGTVKQGCETHDCIKDFNTWHFIKLLLVNTVCRWLHSGFIYALHGIATSLEAKENNNIGRKVEYRLCWWRSIIMELNQAFYLCCSLIRPKTFSITAIIVSIGLLNTYHLPQQ